MYFPPTEILKIAKFYVFTLSLSQWPEVVFREKWLAPCVNLKQTSSPTDLCGRDLHIFSKSWQHISNKNIHPPNDGIIYPIFLTIFDNSWKFWQFCQVGFWWVFQNNFALKVATLRANIFFNLITRNCSKTTIFALNVVRHWGQTTLRANIFNVQNTCPQSRLPSKSSALKVVCPQSRLPSKSSALKVVGSTSLPSMSPALNVP